MDNLDERETRRLTVRDGAGAARAAGETPMEGVLERRKETQPLEMLSCGSVFRNPPDDSAARLIESCGLKGFTVGRAQVSQRHANFIVNLGGATAAEVTKVIVHVLNKVREHHGIELRPEVKFLGFPA